MKPSEALRSELEASPIGRLCLSLYPLDPAARPFMILTGYYDESGTHSGAPLTVLAGFVGPIEEWANLSREWGKVMRKYGITHVRAKELFHKQKQFKGWKDKQVTHLWSDMLYVLQEQKEIFASKTVVLDEDYRMFYVSDGPARRERLDTKYALCFRSLLYFNPLFHRMFYANGSINFVLEAGHKNAGDALRVFNELKDDPNYKARDAIGYMAFGKKRDEPGLQAADALAYWFYRTEVANLKDWNEYEPSISPLEVELADMGKQIIGCVPTPQCMMEMRQNFLRKNKKPMPIAITLGTIEPMVDPTSEIWADSPPS
jgi:hypothetical protein